MVCDRVLAIHDTGKEALNQVIKKFAWDLRKLTKADHELLRYYVDFFKIFKDKSDMMSGEKFTNIHFVHSTVKHLRRHIAQWSNHAVIGSFVRDFSVIFSEYFDFIDHPDHDDYQEIYTITAFLSPYHQAMLSPREKLCAKTFLKSEVLVREEEEQADIGEKVKGPAETQPRPPEGAAANKMPGKRKKGPFLNLIMSKTVRDGSFDGSDPRWRDWRRNEDLCQRAGLQH